MSGFQESARPSRLTLCAMVRDEVDVIPRFLEHHSWLFDHIVVVDHRSIDGTQEVLAACSGSEGERLRCDIEVLRYRGRQYHQSAVSTLLARRAFRRGADWVLVLDADEFVDAADRDELSRILDESRGDVLRLEWVNAFPLTPSEATPAGQVFDTSQSFLTFSVSQSGRNGKVAISRSFWQRNPKFVLPRGNHWVRARRWAPKERGAPAGDLLHFPGRSRAQILRKYHNLVSAQARMAEDYGRRPAEEKFLTEAEGMTPGADAPEVRRLFESVALAYEVGSRRDGLVAREVLFPATPALGIAPPVVRGPVGDDGSRRVIRIRRGFLDKRLEELWTAVAFGGRVFVVLGPVGALLRTREYLRKLARTVLSRTPRKGADA